MKKLPLILVALALTFASISIYAGESAIYKPTYNNVRDYPAWTKSGQANPHHSCRIPAYPTAKYGPDRYLVPCGARVIVIGIDKGYSHVFYNGKVRGYISPYQITTTNPNQQYHGIPTTKPREINVHDWTAIVNTSRSALTVRFTPNGSKKTTVPKGKRVRVIVESADRKWGKIYYDNALQGWVAKSYLRKI